MSINVLSGLPNLITTNSGNPEKYFTAGGLAQTVLIHTYRSLMQSGACLELAKKPKKILPPLPPGWTVTSQGTR